MNRVPFSRAEDEKLVACVQNFPPIYDSNHREYKNQDLRDDIWLQISIEVNRSVEDCKKRWRSIRDTNNRLKRTQRRFGLKSKPPKWILADQLGFLNIVENCKKGKGDRTDLDDSWPEDEDGMKIEEDPLSNENSLDSAPGDGANSIDERIPPPNVVITTSNDTSKTLENLKRKRTEDSGGIEFHKRFEAQCLQDDDPIDVFFKSMALSVKRLPPEMIAEAKIKVCNIVSELELRALRTFADIASEQDDKALLRPLITHE